jgi:hypothetical protein
MFKFILLVLISQFRVFSVFLTCLYVRTKVVRDLERGVSILDTAHEFKPKKIYLKITNEFYFNKKIAKERTVRKTILWGKSCGIRKQTNVQWTFVVLQYL